MEDTITAIATPAGEGGIGIIRISGGQSQSILKKIFIPSGSKIAENRKMTYGHIEDPSSKEIIDEVLCVFMKGPKTYTTEDVVEINCHGGIVPLRKTLELILSCGARMAQPGEFTKRAFLGGRLDLSQAEAVIDIVKAKTGKTFDVAMSQLAGDFSHRIREIREKLIDILVDITVNIDYPDEDIEELTYSRLLEKLTEVKVKIDRILAGAETGRIIQNGLKVAIIGRPNVGKSSLMNMLLKEARAIVTEIPGTTRDTIEETMSIRGIPVILTDTAGIRKTDDVIEKIGIEKSKQSFNNADMVILMIDSSKELSGDDEEIMKYVQSDKTLAVLNKADLDSAVSREDLIKRMAGVKIVETSMKTGRGIDMIEESIEDMVYGGKVKPTDNILLTNARHAGLLEAAVKSAEDAIAMTLRKEALEFIEIDVNSCYQSLGEIIGETATDDIIDEVFTRFCLGK